MAKAKINITNLRNMNNISLYGVYTRTVPFQFDWSAAGLDGVVIRNMVFKSRMCCNASGITLHFAVGGAQFSCPIPLTKFGQVHERYAVTMAEEVALNGNESGLIFSAGQGTCSASMDGWPSDGGGTMCFYGDMYIEVEYDPVSSKLVIPNEIRTETKTQFAVICTSPRLAHKLELTLGSKKVEVQLKAGEKNGTVSLPNSWLEEFPNSLFGEASAKLIVLTGAANQPSSEYAFKVLPNKDSGPSVSLTATPVPIETITQEGISAILNHYCQNLTKANLSATATGRHGASVRSIKVYISDYEKEGYFKEANNSSVSLLTAPLKRNGKHLFIAEATDSRGVTRKTVVETTADAYAAPIVNKAVVFRVDRTGSPNLVGENAKAEIAIAFDTKNTAAKIKLAYKRYGENLWHECDGAQNSGNPFFLTESSQNVSFNTVSGYTIRLRMEDMSGATDYYIDLPSASYVRVVDRKKDSIGFFTAPTHNKSMEIDKTRDFYVHGMEIVELIKAVQNGSYGD